MFSHTVCGKSVSGLTAHLQWRVCLVLKALIGQFSRGAFQNATKSVSDWLRELSNLVHMTDVCQDSR